MRRPQHIVVAGKKGSGRTTVAKGLVLQLEQELRLKVIYIDESWTNSEIENGQVPPAKVGNWKSITISEGSHQ